MKMNFLIQKNKDALSILNEYAMSHLHASHVLLHPVSCSPFP